MSIENIPARLFTGFGERAVEYGNGGAKKEQQQHTD
jgi:hypothetical protein